MLLKLKYCLLSLLLFLTGSGFSTHPSQQISLDTLLKAKSSEELELFIKNNKNNKILEKLCKKQKEEKKIPVACYKLGQNADFWCLKVVLESNKQLQHIKQALQSPFLSNQCKNYLKSRKNLLKYREKDFFLPELKNYFTE